jgi:heme-degrading monooxygenase HmoA
MLIKWIHCKVKSRQRVAFAEAQKAWHILAKVPGFLGQTGGWNQTEKESAYILGFWQDREHYQRFMENEHDAVFHESRQMETYESITVTLARPVLFVPGTYPSLADALVDGQLLRVAHCSVLPHRREAFVRKQTAIWNPGMQQAQGFLAALLAEDLSQPFRYFVFSLWKTEEDHNRYEGKRLESLRRKTRPEEDVAVITGARVKIQADWVVLPSPRRKSGAR